MCASSIISKQMGLGNAYREHCGFLGRIEKKKITWFQFILQTRLRCAFAEENSPDKIVALILIRIQETVVQGCLMERFLSAAWGCRGSAQRGEAAPGRRHSGQTWHWQASLGGRCQGPWGHKIPRTVTVTWDSIASTAAAAVWVACASSPTAAAACAGHWTRPTGILVRPVVRHLATPTVKLPRNPLRCGSKHPDCVAIWLRLQDCELSG